MEMGRGRDVDRFAGALRGGVAAMSLIAAVAFGGAVGAQGASPEASPAPGRQDCTADLGIVRSAKACLVFVHASPDSPAVDVSVIGGDVATRPATGLGFGAAGGYTEVAASASPEATPAG